MKKLEILKEFKRKYAEEDLGQAKDGGKDGKWSESNEFGFRGGYRIDFCNFFEVLSFLWYGNTGIVDWSPFFKQILHLKLKLNKLRERDQYLPVAGTTSLKMVKSS